MQNIYLYGFTGILGRTIKDELLKNYNVVGWLSDNEDASENIWDYLFDKVSNVTIEKDALKNYDFFYKQNFLTFLLMVQRRGTLWKDFFEIRNEFNNLYYNMYHILTNKNVNVVIFSNLPHEGSDYILYSICKLLNLKTILFYQSIFPNKAFVITSLSDFGSFQELELLFSDQSISIHKDHTEKLFYMQEVEEKELMKKEKFFTKVYIKTKITIRFFLKKINNIIKYKKEKNIFLNISLKLLKIIDNIKYKINLKNVSLNIEEINLKSKDKKLIYVPLHLQPELTTTAIGGLYEDQIVMIETLSLAIGDKGIIIVKENPKQTSFQRKSNFFKRLLGLKNVVFIDTSYSSTKLIKMCDLTAVVTGTAGWETIKGEKICLVFGQAWYSTLPNCYTYHSDLNIHQLLEKKYTFDFKYFEKNFTQLMYKCVDTIVDKGYISQVENFDYNKNAISLVNSVNKILNLGKL